MRGCSTSNVNKSATGALSTSINPIISTQFVLEQWYKRVSDLQSFSATETWLILHCTPVREGQMDGR
jgi:hypothetical protein